MERLQLNETQQAFVDAYRQETNVQVGDPVLEGTNLVSDDHVQVDNNWYALLLGASVASPGCIDTYVPDWGDFTMAIWQLDVYVTDRAGPNGETMPVYDEQQLAARAAAANPQEATAGHERHHRRDFRQALRDAIKRMPHNQQHHARQVLREKGVLGKDEP